MQPEGVGIAHEDGPRRGRPMCRPLRPRDDTRVAPSNPESIRIE